MAQKTLEDIRKELNKMSPEVQRTLREYTVLSETIRQAIPEIQQTNDSVRRLADATRGNMPNVVETNEKAKVAIDNWNRAGERLNLILQANEKQFSAALENLNK